MPIELIGEHKAHWLTLPQRSPHAPSRRVVLLHGLFVGNLASWYLSAAHPLSEHMSLLLYDLRGHGKSELTPTGYDLATLATDLEGLLERVGWSEGPLTLIGHSYGGRVALEWAQRSPQRVEQLILVDAPLLKEELSVGQPFLSPLTDLSQGPSTKRPTPAGPEALIALLPAPLQLHFRRGGRQSRRALERWWGLLFESSLSADLSAEPELTAERLHPLLGRVSAVYGERSPCLSSLTWLKGALTPSPRSELIKGAGHYLPSEAPEALTSALLRLLSAGVEGKA